MAKKKLQHFTILSKLTSNHLRMSTRGGGWGALYREYSGVTVMGKCKTLFLVLACEIQG